MDPTPPHAIPVVVQASRTLAPGRLELVLASMAETGSTALADPQAIIISVNDGGGWREPVRQLPAGWSLDDYRVSARKPRAWVRGAGRDDAGRSWYYVRLSPAETAEEYADRKRQFADSDRRRAERTRRLRAKGLLP